MEMFQLDVMSHGLAQRQQAWLKAKITITIALNEGFNTL